MISKWNYLPFTSEQQSIADELSIRFPGCSTISRLMALRGITSLDEVEKFLNPSLSDLHDPFLMQDMDKAVNRLNKALGRKEKILIYGDYDVDGITSVALVCRYLQNYYSNVEYYIPTRYEEGYGVSDKSIDFAASLGVSLIIVLDCGIKAVEEIEYAKSKGLKVEVATISTVNDIQQADQSLLGKVDAFYEPTDNVVASAMPTLTAVTTPAKKPVICGEPGMVDGGGLATYGIDYYALGVQAGDMAADILEGKKKPQDMAVQTAKDLSVVVNKDAAEAMGVKIPDDIMKNAKVVTTKK